MQGEGRKSGSRTLSCSLFMPTDQHVPQSPVPGDSCPGILPREATVGLKGNVCEDVLRCHSPLRQGGPEEEPLSLDTDTLKMRGKASSSIKGGPVTSTSPLCWSTER